MEQEYSDVLDRCMNEYVTNKAAELHFMAEQLDNSIKNRESVDIETTLLEIQLAAYRLSDDVSTFMKLKRFVKEA